jgi:predicted DNA-binding transcriptional regulator AlpA
LAQFFSNGAILRLILENMMTRVQPDLPKTDTGTISTAVSQLPPTGFLRLRQITGSSKAKPPVLPIIPISNAAWWAGVKEGIYPKPVKLGPRTTAWRVEDILALIESLTEKGEK